MSRLSLVAEFDDLVRSRCVLTATVETGLHVFVTFLLQISSCTVLHIITVLTLYQNFDGMCHIKMFLNVNSVHTNNIMLVSVCIF